MALKTIQQNKITWHHVDEVDDEVLRFLKKEFKFHPMDLKDVGATADEGKLDVYKNYIFITFLFPILQRDIGRIKSVEFNIFLGPNYLVTIQKGKFKPMRDFYFKAQNSNKFRRVLMTKDSAHLAYRVLDVLFRDTQNITKYISRKLRELEDEVYGDEFSEDTARRIAYLRRKILGMKRIYDPQVEVVNELSKLKAKFLPEDANIYFDDIDDYVDKVSNFLENQKFVMKDLLEVHDSLVTHKTNKVIKILTLISVGMLPLTLLSGIYGMNIDLPFAGNSWFVWGIFAALLLFIAGVLRFMKKSGLL